MFYWYQYKIKNYLIQYRYSFIFSILPSVQSFCKWNSLPSEMLCKHCEPKRNQRTDIKCIFAQKTIAANLVHELHWEALDEQATSGPAAQKLFQQGHTVGRLYSGGRRKKVNYHLSQFTVLHKGGLTFSMTNYIFSRLCILLDMHNHLTKKKMHTQQCLDPLEWGARWTNGAHKRFGSCGLILES